ncbi:sugar ABC transporter substrate-binding protein [Paramaledivibacter caminithermalis]|uniref:Xylose-binding protein n=1 Tax=Paramaledivibacter caminithermalis (strain DSM 15212 / CIP 107654 / DViRD3) TaxID=1121301 RepID=A0A1M6RX35_PARC5|nr:substrate-binding domain-containing protein [Paramaledivibacter caminithermalis]SHK36847.1 xylose-binding protein [Paramaledivibacter caminithermalis DSM 15212]
MNYKKYFYIITIIVLSIILAILIFYTVKILNLDTFTGNSNDEHIKVEDNKIKIGFSIGTLKEERWIKDRDILMAKMRELGADIIVQNANNDDEDQLQQVKHLLSQDIDVLIIVPNDINKAASAVELAKRQGVKVISYDRLVLNSDIDLYVSFDSRRTGELMAEYVLSEINKGNILIINGAKNDNTTKIIKEGYDKVLKNKIESGKIKIIAEEWSINWMKEHAFKVTHDFLSKGEKIDAIICGNDSLAGGAIEALSEYRMAGKVVVVGQDADLAACQRIVEGTQLMTVYGPVEKLAEAAAEMSIKLAYGEKIKLEDSIFNGKRNIPQLIIESIAVNKTNIDDTVIKDGFHLRDEIYRKSK